MKFNLLSSVSSLAMGGLMIASLPGTARANLTCPTISFGQSASCSESFTIGGFQTDFTNGQTGVTYGGSFSLFQKVGGEQLTSVVLSESGHITTTGSLTNLSKLSVSNYTYSGGLTLYVFGGSGAPSGFPSRTFLSHTASGTNYAYVPAAGISAGLGTVAGTLAKSGKVGSSTKYTSSGTFAPPSTVLSNLSGYYGNGTFTVLADGTAYNDQITSGGNFNASVVTTGDAILTLTFDYTYPLPEPTTMGILGAGLVGVGVLRRRSKRAK